MTDLLLTDDGDLAMQGGDLVLDPGLGSAVLRSIHTDRRASAEELARFGGGDPRGWWAEDDGDPVGSKLWLLAREKQTPQVLSRAREYVREALAWLVRDGIASAVEVVASYPDREQLRVEVRVTRGTAARWAHLWARPQPAYLAVTGLTLVVALGETTR